MEVRRGAVQGGWTAVGSGKTAEERKQRGRRRCPTHAHARTRAQQQPCRTCTVALDPGASLSLMRTIWERRMRGSPGGVASLNVVCGGWRWGVVVASRGGAGRGEVGRGGGARARARGCVRGTRQGAAHACAGHPPRHPDNATCSRARARARPPPTHQHFVGERQRRLGQRRLIHQRNGGGPVAVAVKQRRHDAAVDDAWAEGRGGGARVLGMGGGRGGAGHRRAGGSTPTPAAPYQQRTQSRNPLRHTRTREGAIFGLQLSSGLQAPRDAVRPQEQAVGGGGAWRDAARGQGG